MVGESHISPDAIVVHLERVLSSPNFESAPQLCNFLRFAVTEKLAGRANQIKQYTIATKAFGRASDFDAEADPIVRITASRLRRALSEYYQSEGAEDLVRIEIPKGTYVPTFQHHNPSRAEDSPLVAPSRGSHRKRLDVEQLELTPHFGPSLAVLPFRNLNEELEHACFATGLSERIIIALTHFPKFTVIGPLSREKLSVRQMEPRDIGREYEVRFLLDGHVRWYDDFIRVSAKLTDVRTGIHVWANTYDRDVGSDSLLNVEDEVCSQVVATIADSYGVIPRMLANDSFPRHINDLQAYDAVLRYYHAMAVLTPEGHRQAVQALRHAVELEPDSGLLVAMLADTYAQAYLEGIDEIASSLDDAENLALRAVGLDPTCQVARYALAYVYFLRKRRAAFIREAEAAIALNPNRASTLAGVAFLFAAVGEYDRGLQLMQRAMHLNPHHPGWYFVVHFINHCRKGDFGAALAVTERFTMPESYIGYWLRAAALGRLDRRKEASVALEAALEIRPQLRMRYKELMHRSLYSNEHVDMLLEGWRKAGLK